MTDKSAYSGSPFLQMLGTELEEWRDGYARIGLPLKPVLLNRSGVVHGGVIAAMLDHAGGLSGLFCTMPGNRRYGMTLSLTSNYARQSKTGRLIAIGNRVSGGRKIYFANSQVLAEDGQVLATGSGVYRYRGGSETPEGTASHPQDGRGDA